MFYKSLVRPLLFRKDPEKSHDQILALLSHLEFLYGSLNDFYRVADERLTVRIGPLTFPNPVGLAAGFDKNAVAPKVHIRLRVRLHGNRRGHGSSATGQSQTAVVSACRRITR